MESKMPLKAKIITGVSAVVAVAAVVVLIIVLVTGGGSSNPAGEGDLTSDISTGATVSAPEEPALPPNPTEPSGTTGPKDGPTTPGTQTPEPTTTEKPTPEPTSTETPTPEPTSTETPTPEPTDPATPTPPHAQTWSYAIIVDWMETMIEYKDFAFDYVDWLTGTEAVDKYMQDYGCTREEAEVETEEFGYIRNVNPHIRWFSTTSDTVYYLPDSSVSITPVKVDNDTFRQTMITAINNGETWMTFVKVTVSGDYIVEIEWVYRP